MIKSIKKVFNFGYDGAESGKRRNGAVHSKVKHEDDELKAKDRRALNGNTRDINRNFAIVSWAVRKHLDYVSTFTFQAKTGNEALNQTLESIMSWYSRPENCDVTGRHSLQRMVRTAEACRTIDGDMGLGKISNGKLQAIEGDRVAPPVGSKDHKIEDYPNGVKTTKAGKHKSYSVCSRLKGGRLAFERVIPARHVFWFGYYHRFDQTRGVSPLACAINSFVDIYEATNYALAKAKIAQIFGMAFYRDAVEPIGDGDENESTSGEYEVGLNKGPFVLDLEPGDRAEFLENKTPSSEFQAFTGVMTAIALKSLDIPYCFYDESAANYNGSRLAVVQYEQSAKAKRDDVRDLLNRITFWRLSIAILNDEIKLPAGMALKDIKFEWTPLGQPWLDPLKEIKADNEAVAGGLISRRRVCKRRGDDFNEIVNELAEEKELMDKLGLTPDTNYEVKDYETN